MERIGMVQNFKVTTLGESNFEHVWYTTVVYM